MPDVARQPITATVAPTNAGTVAINSNQAANEVTAELFEGSQVTLTAKANDGYIFSHWSKGAETISTESTCKVTVDANDNDYVANFIEYSGPTTAEYTISPTTGTLTNGTSKSSSWTFTKTSECPAELTLQSTCGTTAVNAMSINSGILQLYAFDYDMQSGITYTLGVPNGYLIIGYELTYKMGSSFNITIENETMKQTATRSDQIFTASGLSTTSTSFNLTGTAANNFVKVTKFVVTVQKEGSPETGIKTIEIPVSESIYNLKGEKLYNITEPGIYIVNGKKILKK
jgi:hypothetical protein